MTWTHSTLGWDDTIRPSKSYGLSHNINTLSLSPDNKRKRRHEEYTSPSKTNNHSSTSATSVPSPHSHSPTFATSAAAAASSSDSLPTSTFSPSHNQAYHSSSNFAAAGLGGTKRTKISVANARVNKGIGKPSISLRRRLDALDRDQLAMLVEHLVDQQPDVAQTVDDLVPHITVPQALGVLKHYQQDLKSHIPLGDPQGDYAFLRVRPQYTSFFVALADYTVSFLECENGDIGKVLEFLDGATALVHDSPRWNSASNNQLLQRAYQELEQAWLQALEKASDNSPFAVMAGAAWDSRFQAHCEKSKGAMRDSRSKDISVQVVPRCEGVIS